MVCVIHTFGRDLKWNPYVHVLVTEGAIRKDNHWQPIKYFHYEMLRKRWQHLLLKSLKEAMPKNKRIILV
ncbi:transposase, partial [Anaerobranca gottschalkii]|uniref:transposase n=1 Tax=Anaerobranca gottschalkii TaxID=108328 RepID=UPI0015A6A5E5